MQGHLPSILAMADLYYYGARGLPRDYPRALRYYEQAAALGDQSGLCGAAGMYLKGEGVPANATYAVSLYETASEMGSIRALNGLGYMYFYGQSVPQNQTKAFEYFLAAAGYETDGDSMFNAAHCLENGIGVEKDMDRAVQLYTVGAKKLGSFNCIRSLAGIHLEVHAFFSTRITDAFFSNLLHRVLRISIVCS
jgi:TPR repeat protein